MSASSLIFFESPTPGQSTESYLDHIEESWNKRIDKDVSTLGEGLGLMIKELEVSGAGVYQQGLADDRQVGLSITTESINAHTTHHDGIVPVHLHPHTTSHLFRRVSISSHSPTQIMGSAIGR